MSEKKLFLVLLFVLLLSEGVLADGNEHNDTIDVKEKLGQYISLNAAFLDENGKVVKLRDLMGKPTIVAPVYLSCTHTCPLLLGSLAETLGKAELTPGKDYAVITLSFDDRDTPEHARKKKRNYIRAIGGSFPEESWKFLTGNAENIQRFTGSLGFRFKREENGFSHPRALIFLSPNGKVSRYLYGTTFLPFDIKMALAEASQEKKELGHKMLLLYCFGYDSQEKRYVFNSSRVFLTVLFFLILSLGVFLIITRKKISKRGPLWTEKI
jgi:protein SCO1/2